MYELFLLSTLNKTKYWWSQFDLHGAQKISEKFQTYSIVVFCLWQVPANIWHILYFSYMQVTASCQVLPVQGQHHTVCWLEIQCMSKRYTLDVYNIHLCQQIEQHGHMCRSAWCQHTNTLHARKCPWGTLLWLWPLRAFWLVTAAWETWIV